MRTSTSMSSPLDRFFRDMKHCGGVYPFVLNEDQVRGPLQGRIKAPSYSASAGFSIDGDALAQYDQRCLRRIQSELVMTCCYAK
jgi:hypothetical protein